MSNKPIVDEFDDSDMFAAPEPVITKPQPVGNPLAAYFRLPGLSVSLPTNGAFMPAGSIDFDDDHQVAVLPMRAADELLLSSPDALMNNTAIVGLIRSCVPAIKRPELISAPDLDVLLLAIRVASSGETMGVELECPSCKTRAEVKINLPQMLNTTTSIPAENPVRINDDMVAYLRPHDMQDQSTILMAAFKETRAAQALDANPELSDEQRSEGLSKIMARMGELNSFGVTTAIQKIVIPGTEVTKREHIAEFLENTDKNTLQLIRDALEKLNNLGLDKSVPVECEECGHQWDTAIEFNPSTFFEERSSD